MTKRGQALTWLAVAWGQRPRATGQLLPGSWKSEARRERQPTREELRRRPEWGQGDSSTRQDDWRLEGYWRLA
jgi:hypothetical protein